MDAATKEVIDNFVTFLTNEFAHKKDLKHIQFEKWTLEDTFKVRIKYFYKDKERYIFVDVRELKDNKDRFEHLTGNIIDQLTKEL